MTDQQDLMALAVRWQVAADYLQTRHSDDISDAQQYVLRQCASELEAALREAAAQLGLASELVAFAVMNKAGSVFDLSDRKWMAELSATANNEKYPDVEGKPYELKVVPLYSSPRLPAGVPDGWVLVPKEANDRMLDAMAEYFTGESKWAAAIAAAPQPDNKESR